MSGWTPDELRAIGGAEELQLASARPDGSLRPFVTIWSGVVGEDLYVRSAHGPENGWFRRAQHSGIGRISAGGLEKDVAFVAADADVADALDDVLHAKYDRFGPAFVDPITGPDTVATTLRIVPRG
ncbi:DUF2255 family protein [Microbacterium sp. P04]|uniref:DUF2255 family protein n=1 Tax=Microbacterium sp. P04 TaxID=3366947 RepID=UPI0037470743